MKKGKLTISRIMAKILVLALVMYPGIFAGTADAAGVTLSGTVSSTSGPVGQVDVTVTDPATSAVVGDTSTAADGSYSLGLSSGIYNIAFTPLASSGFSVTTAPNFDLTQSRQLSVQLAGTRASPCPPPQEPSPTAAASL